MSARFNPRGQSVPELVLRPFSAHLPLPCPDCSFICSHVHNQRSSLPKSSLGPSQLNPEGQGLVLSDFEDRKSVKTAVESSSQIRQSFSLQ